MNLTEKAKSFKMRYASYNPTREEIDLSIAWAKSEVTTTQAVKAIGKKGTTNFYQLAATRLKHAVKTGILIENKKK